MRLSFTVFVLLVCLIASESSHAEEDSLKVVKPLKDLSEVIVTGQYRAQSARNSVYSVRTISSERIRMRAATSLLQVLNTEPGIRFTNDQALGTSDISLMGVSGQNVKILLDGVPMLDRGEIRESLGQIDINTVERIEIVEGPMSVSYGTDALGGVINIITRSSAGQKQVRLSARLQEESAGSEYDGFRNRGVHNQNLNIALLRDKWSVDGTFSRNNFGGWRGASVGRSLDWNPKDQLLGGLKLGFNNSRFAVWYRVNALDESITLLGNSNPNTQIATDREYVTKRYFHQAQSDWNISSDLSISTAISYTDYSRRTRTTTLNMLSGDRRLSLGAGEQDRSVFKSSFLRSTAQYRLSDYISLQPGIEINLNRASGDRINGSPDINDYSFFLSSEIKPADWLNIRPGFRAVRNSVYDAPPLIPSVNTLFRLSEAFSFRLAYARGFRAPSLRELYFMFFDASHAIQGNTDLKAEYSNSFNTSLSWQRSTSGSLSAEFGISGFYNLFKNKIDVATDPENPNVSTYINIGNNRTAGGGIQANLSWNNIKTVLGFIYIGRYNQYAAEASGAVLPDFAWSPEFSTNVLYSFPKPGLNLSLAYKFNGRRPQYQKIAATDMVELAHINSFNLADFTVSKSFRQLSLNAGLKNIFDVTRVVNSSADTGSAHSTGGPLPVSYGRSYFLGLSYNLSFNYQ